jgi:hypothetical protein
LLRSDECKPPMSGFSEFFPPGRVPGTSEEPPCVPRGVGTGPIIRPVGLESVPRVCVCVVLDSTQSQLSPTLFEGGRSPVEASWYETGAAGAVVGHALAPKGAGAEKEERRIATVPGTRALEASWSTVGPRFRSAP